MPARANHSNAAEQPPALFTIGHSTHPVKEFMAMLLAHDITRLIDVRTIPRSRHNPQFNAQFLPDSLSEAGILYRHAPQLGGLRHPAKDSTNTGWRNASFRGFADYMQSATFTAAIDELIDVVRAERVVLMCAEAVPWRCHRSLIADALLVRGFQIGHIIDAEHYRLHRLTPFAHVSGHKVTYPPAKEY